MSPRRDLPTIAVSHAVEQGAAALSVAIRSRSPLKVSGLIDGWPAAAWDFAALRATAGDRPVTALLGLPSRGGELPGGQESYERRMTFGEFLDYAVDPGDAAACYLGYARPAELIDDYDTAFDFTSLTGVDPHDTDTRLWIGSAGTCSGLHSDLKDNVFAQITGAKRVFLVPLRETHLVYPYLDNIVNSRVDPEHLDVERFPRFRRARVFSTVVGPGDVLYIPRGWWHYLRSETPSVSINHWFGEPIPARVFLAILARLGPRYLGRTALDAVRYGLLKGTYHKDFFFTPASTGERLYNLIRHGNFSRENDPSAGN
jgi:lysine-specific demethylase 8